MAKQQFQKITTAFDATITAGRDNSITITLSGLNSKGTLIRVTMSAPDYFLKYMAGHIVKAVEKRMKTAKSLKDDVLTEMIGINNI